MKRLNVLLVLVLVAAVLASCAPKATPTPVPPKVINLTLWFFGSEDQKFPDGTLIGQWWRDNLVVPFEAANPNIKVDLGLKGYEAGGTTLFVDTALAAGTPPDIYQDGLLRLSKYGSKGVFVSLNPILTAAKKATLMESWVPQVTTNGETWAILTGNTFPDALIVNRAMFKAAGAEDLLPKEPDRDWTTEQFEKALAAVTKAPDRYGTMFFCKTPSYDHCMFAYAAQFGSRRYNPGDYSKVIENSPESIAAHTWIKSLLDKGLAVPGPAGLVDDDADAYLLAGKIAIAAGGWYEYGLVMAAKKDGSLKIDFDPYMVNYPHPADKKPGPLANLGGGGWAAFKTGNKDKEAAALKFIDFATQVPFVAKYLVASTGGAGAAGGGMGGMPMVKGVDMNALYAGDKEAAWILRIMEERGVVDLGYGVQAFSEIRAEWAKMRQAIWGGEKSPAQGLADFEKKANELLSAK